MEEYNYNAQGGSVTSSENIVGGIIGAFIGTIPGVILWVLIGTFGFIASISTVLMLAGAIKGYTILGKSMSVRGVIISAIFTVIMTFAAVHISYIVEAIRAWGFDGFSQSSVISFLRWIWSEGEIRASLLKDLGIAYLFLIVYGISYVRRRIK